MKEREEQEDIFSKVLRAGRRTYFFDVRRTKANDYYLTITESKKIVNDDGTFHYYKHKIYLYKEDFNEFQAMLKETANFIINEKGLEVISERHQKNYTGEKEQKTTSEAFTELSFEEI
ncbi:PUR family DNA/RNA-binding protein [Flavobacteriaceae bacterium]|nr:PUR family DNA/RNA-binding protein [Flavobacteriaceae bacterium]